MRLIDQSVVLFQMALEAVLTWLDAYPKSGTDVWMHEHKGTTYVNIDRPAHSHKMLDEIVAKLSSELSVVEKTVVRGIWEKVWQGEIEGVPLQIDYDEADGMTIRTQNGHDSEILGRIYEVLRKVYGLPSIQTKS